MAALEQARAQFLSTYNLINWSLWTECEEVMALKSDLDAQLAAMDAQIATVNAAIAQAQFALNGLLVLQAAYQAKQSLFANWRNAFM